MQGRMPEGGVRGSAQTDPRPRPLKTPCCSTPDNSPLFLTITTKERGGAGGPLTLGVGRGRGRGAQVSRSKSVSFPAPEQVTAARSVWMAGKARRGPGTGSENRSGGISIEE